ncbi:hypothetical protein NliqN6_2711 [Naganishia liquefaciens]|uniref:YetF C-terminal domain-containing protein n=1 Tax=Naganishia liquefaciens TaxID=104408 RepID=A0A8H3TSN9_9TREE|nr:hypothetical protein NliqN6_2711 [Naganishia liquefaciens]
MSSEADTNSSGIGFKLLQESDFYVEGSILHPLAAGSIGILFLFVYFRIMSNRCSAPVTLFDTIVGVALGSVLGAIVTGTSLTRGILSLCVLLFFQFFTSACSSNMGTFIERTIASPPLVITFRGQALTKVMKIHRISTTDLNSALRKENIWHIKEIECVIIESTGLFSVYKRCNYPQDYPPEVLLDIKGYKALHEKHEKSGKGVHDSSRDHHDDDIANECA